MRHVTRVPDVGVVTKTGGPTEEQNHSTGA